MINDEHRLYDYIGVPIHKILEFFVPPVLKPSNYVIAKYFDK